METQVSAGEPGRSKPDSEYTNLTGQKVIMREGEDLGRHSQAERAEE
jgi:hypothetical protein